MVVYIISLQDERSLKRREPLIKEIEAANLDKFPIQIIGIDGRKVNKEKYKNILGDHFINGHYKNRSGTIGCALSHVSICMDALENKIKDDILIFEDDARINSRFLHLLPKEIPEDYHVLFLHQCHPINYNEQNPTGTDIRKLTYNIDPWLTQGYCYMLNGRKMADILREVLPINSCLDLALKYAPNLNKYIINPELNISNSRVDCGSYRQDIDIDDIKLRLKFLNVDRSNIIKIDTNTLFKISVDPSMTREYAHFRTSFNFFIIDNNNESVRINDYIDIKFIENKIGPDDEIDIKFKPMAANLFKYNTPYTLKAQFQYYHKYIEDNITIFYQK